jgi:hypothetical protein
MDDSTELKVMIQYFLPLPLMAVATVVAILMRDHLLEEMEDQVAAGQIVMRVQLVEPQHQVRVAMVAEVVIALVVAAGVKVLRVQPVY